jgi:short-subunit dehydrogenase
MQRSLTGCTALVTGGSSGIGLAIAAGLARAGAHVALVGRDEGRLRQAAASLADHTRALVLPAELEDVESIMALARAVRERCSTLDVLVHSAGAVALGPMRELPVAELDRQYRVNVRAPFVLTQALLPMLETSRGQIVFVNSSAGLQARAGVSAYAASKHALKALADSVRDEVHATGIRVLSVYPGRTATPMQEAVSRMEGTAFVPECCLQPDDVAAAVLGALTLPATAEVKDISIRPLHQ